MKRNLFRRIAALVMALALCAGGASATIADFAIEQPTVYATKHGTCYHYDPVCSGMKNAQATTAGEALAEGKTACPVCIPAAEPAHRLRNEARNLLPLRPRLLRHEERSGHHHQ